MEIFIVYGRATGFIKSSGRIDRESDEDNRDGSTVLEYVERKLTNPELTVVYLPDQELPDSGKRKIVDGEIVEMSIEDQLTVLETQTPSLKTTVEKLEMRVTELEETIKQ